MTYRKPPGSPAFKKAGHANTKPRVVREDLVAARRTNLAMLEETIGWTYNYLLTSVQIRRVDDYWKVMVKVVTPQGPKIAYVDCKNFGKACEVTQEMADMGHFSWKHDKHPVWTRSRRRTDRYIGSNRGAASPLD